MITTDNYRKSESASLSEKATTQILQATVWDLKQNFHGIYAILSSEMRTNTSTILLREHVKRTCKRDYLPIAILNIKKIFHK